MTEAFWDEASLSDDVQTITCSGGLEVFKSLCVHALRDPYGMYCRRRHPDKGKVFDISAKTLVDELVKIGGRHAVASHQGDRSYHSVVWDDAIVCVTDNGGERAWQASLVTSTERMFNTIDARLREHLIDYAVEPSTDTIVYTLAGSRGSYGLRQLGVERRALVRENYSPSVLDDADYVLKNLLAADPYGRFALIEGPTGGGKTRLVRGLSHALKGRCRVIEVSAHLVPDLSGPDLIGALLDCSLPTVLIVEDADAALLSRNHSHGNNLPALAAMLNLSDGIRGEMLDFRIVATTNAKVEHLDSALERDGRLIRRISVDRLPPEQTLAIAAREAKLDASELSRYVDESPMLSAARTMLYRGAMLGEAYGIAHRVKSLVENRSAG